MKIKEGGVMDVQKEREAFENHLKKMGKTDNETFSKNEDDSYQMDIIHFGWKIWQAAIARMEVRINTLDEMLLNQGEALAQAKAQAVPEGFVLVKKELPEQIAEKMAIDRIDKPRHENDPVWSEITEQSYKDQVKSKKWEFWRDYKAMIEAQEPSHD
ncbi:hypothetical protein [Acinetobacter wanghuae]|uniref:hypothetical protein n=1 Tax=Acinetobacter wanghuae TaxID=2662362 RepID=UPI003AF7B2A8